MLTKKMVMGTLKMTITISITTATKMALIFFCLLLSLILLLVNQSLVVNCTTILSNTTIITLAHHHNPFVHDNVTENDDGLRYRRFVHNNHDQSSFLHNYFFNSLPSQQQFDHGFWNNNLDDDDDQSPHVDQTEFSGPMFTMEPTLSHSSSSMSTYDNQSMLVTLTCKAYGYPIPKIYWRVDNITMMNHHSPMDESIAETEAEYSFGTPQYWPHLNAMVTLRNDGQTLIIGGNGGSAISNDYQQNYLSDNGGTFRSPWNNPSNQHTQHHYSYTISHQIECLATNRFGSIISRPIIVQQQVSTITNSATTNINNNNNNDVNNNNHHSSNTLNKNPSSSSTWMGSILKPIGPQNGKILLPSFHHHNHHNNIFFHNQAQHSQQQQQHPLPSSSIHIQLYDEFVSRGNVAVLKCLVNNNHNNNNFQASSSSSSSSSSSASSSSASLSGDSASVVTSNHHLPSSSYHWSSMTTTLLQQQQQQPFYTFEWKIKNGPAAAAAVAASASSIIPSIDPIVTIRSNQTQGKYTAYPSGELHVRDVDEHDARRTYQCAIYPPKSSSLSSSSSNQQQYPFTNGKQSMENHPLAESTFAQIILSGGEKDIFPPRILHRIEELDANEGQPDPLLIPCAANSQPLSTYKWYWIPFGVNFDWETEITSLLLSQQQQQQKSSSQSSSSSSSSSPSSSSLLNSYAIPMISESMVTSGSTSNNHHSSNNIIIDQKHRHHQLLMLNRLRSFGSTLLIPGRISQSNAGHYVAIVSNSVGFDRCITTVNVRSPLGIRVDSVPIVGNNNNQNINPPDSSSSSSSNSNKPKLIRVIRGETIRLRCIVHGFPLSDVYWLHNTNLLMVSSGGIGGNSGNGNKQQQQQQQKQQSSKILNMNSGGSTSSVALNYHYHYGSDINNRNNNNNDVNYHYSSGNGALTRFSTDSKGSKQQQREDHDISAIQHLDLLLDDRSKSGMYQCFARNRFETVQTTFQIQVVDQPPSIVEHFEEQIIHPGESISLRCMSRGAPLAQIEWSLDRMPVPTSARFRFGDFVVKDNSRHQTKSSSSTSIESLLVSHFNVTSARVEDGGLYRCTAKNLAGQTYYEARINVIGKGQVKLHTPNITVLSGTDTELNCPYYGYPIKMISWFGKDGSKRKLPTNGRQHISPNGTLHISKINKKEDEGFYECEVQFQQQDGSGQQQQSSRTKLYLNVITGPRIDNFTFAPNLEEGMRSVVVCAVIAGDPPIRIHWLKDGQPLATTADRKIEMVNEFTSSITFTALKRRHAGRYTCIASNLASSDHHFADLKVNVAPVWLFEPRDILAISGQMLVMNCQAEGIPDPQVRWKVESNDLVMKPMMISSNDANKNIKKNKLLQSEKASSSTTGGSSSDSNSFHAVISNPHMQILENGSLIIKEVNRDDHRRYMCSAFNGVGSGISTIIRLSVHFPPQFINGYFESKQIKLGETITMTCLVKIEYIDEFQQQSSNKNNRTSNNLDEIVDLRWYKDITGLSGSSKIMDTTNSDRFHVSSTFEVTEFGSSSVNISSIFLKDTGSSSSLARFYATKLTIRQVERGDTGVYLCTAQNYYGFIRKNFTVSVLEQPERPEEIRADEITSTSIKLTWPQPFDGNSPINEYVISYRTISGAISNTVTLAPYAAYMATSTGTTSNNMDQARKLVSFQLSDLTPATAYVIQVKAKNALGYSQFSDSITVKTAEEPPNDVPTDVTILPLNTRSLKISWRPPSRKLTTTLTTTGSNKAQVNPVYIPPITGYYIGYRPHLDAHHYGDNNNEFIFKTIKSSASSIPLTNAGNDPTTSLSSLETHESFVLTNLKRGTRYDIKIQAFNLAGAGPSSSEYQGKTLDFDVPAAPRIRALKSNLSSIELMWSVQGEEPISGFVISYKPATQNEMVFSVNTKDLDSKDAQSASATTTTTVNDVNEWKTIKIELETPMLDETKNGQGLGDRQLDEDNNIGGSFQTISTFQRRTYILSGLRCGTKYFIYINAFNSVGQGDPSEVILTRTEGNMPVPPESVQDFVQPNVTTARVNLNQWKRLGCPIEQFEIDFHIYGDVSTNRKLTLKPLSSQLSLPQSLPLLVENDDNSGNNYTEQQQQQQQQNIIELNNLLPGSWYELLVRANTEAGSVHRDYIFSTKRADGSTIAPLTLKAMVDEYGRSNLQQRSFLGSSLGVGGGTNTFVNSFRTNMFAQLHYIVPVSCTLVILFLVFVVVCAIQTNRQNFMFSLVASTTRQRHHKVASGKNCQMYHDHGHHHHSSIDGESGTGGGMVLDGSQTEPSMTNTTTNTTYCTTNNKEHIYGTNPGVGAAKLTCSNSIDELLDGNNQQRSSGYNIRTDSCHSLAGHCDHQSKKTDLAQSSSNKPQQYPLYSLPVPYATSAVQFMSGGGGTSSTTTTSTTATGGGGAPTNGGAVRLVMARKPDDQVYGTLKQQQQSQQFAIKNGQFTEMYCDGPTTTATASNIQNKFPFTLTDPQIMSIVDNTNAQNWTSAAALAASSSCPASSIPHSSSSSNVHHQPQQQQQHQYELPFVFKPAPINHNESTAF